MITCCRLERRARQVVGVPWFDQGGPITVTPARDHQKDVGKLALVSHPPARSRVGRVAHVLGNPDSIPAVMEGLLAERVTASDSYDYDPDVRGEPLGAAAEHQLASLADEIPHMEERLDLRSQLCVTIDPPTAQDHDDAIALLRLPADVAGFEGGNPVGGKLPAGAAWIVWVHIADVAAYVETGSPLDLRALDRAMSVYLPGISAPMLPARLSSDLCSLRPGVDRGCVSARIVLDADAAVLGTSFHRTVIRSARRLSYDLVDEVLEGRNRVDPAIDAMLGDLDAFTAAARAVRMNNGALDLASTEVAFDLTEPANERASREPESPSHRLVEECMLLANLAVGKRLSRAQLPGIWRAHDEPDPASIDALVTMLASLEVPTPPVPADMGGRDAARLAARIARQVRTYTAQSGRGRFAFPSLVLRSLQQAVYRAEPAVHSGLAVRDYAHFTSPIRRYPDLVVHRSLLASIGATVDASPAPTALGAIAEHVSTVEREVAIKVERQANAIALSHLLMREWTADPTRVWEGEVNGVIASGAFVSFGEVYEGYVPARTIGDGERFDLDESGLALVGGRSGEVIKLGDRIQVAVSDIDRSSGKVGLRRVVGSTPESARRALTPDHGARSGAKRPGPPRGDRSQRVGRRGRPPRGRRR